MYQIYFDGACEPVNPGGTASYGFIIKKDGKTIAEEAKIVGQGEGMTNNLAEYEGLLAALKYLSTRQFAISQNSLAPRSSKSEVGLLIYTDSNLVYNMVAKNWGWSKKKTIWRPHKDRPHLKELLFKILRLLEKFDYQIKWIPREQNQAADDLSKKHLTYK